MTDPPDIPGAAEFRGRSFLRRWYFRKGSARVMQVVPLRRLAISFVASGIVLAGLTLVAVPSDAATTYASRRDAVILSHYEHPSPVMTGCADHRGYVAYATAALWLNRSVADANNRLAAVRIGHITGQSCDASIDVSRANLWLSTMLRPYFLFKVQSLYFPGRLTPEAANNLVAQMWAYAAPYSKRSEAADPWSIYDSENHDAQAESFDLLAAQAFMHRGDYMLRKYADGSTPAQQYQAWRAHWSTYFDEVAKRGLFIEVGSPVYHSYLVDAILNIYNFAEDPILRKKAGMVLDLDFADYAQQALNNIWGGAKSRSYPADSYEGADDEMTNFGTFLFGPGTARPKNTLGLATSGYQPPPAVASLATNRVGRGAFAYVARRPGVGTPGWDTNKDWHITPTKSVLTSSYVTPDYVMGTAELNPNDAHIAPSSQNRWEGIIFGTGAGDRVYPQAAPTSVSKTMDAFISVQNQNVLITRKQGYATEPTLVYFPQTLDSVVEAGGWIFVKEGAAYLAVRPAAGTYTWLTSAKNKATDINQRFVKLSSVASPIIFECGRTAQYPTLAAFETDILNNARSYVGGVLHYSASNDTAFTFYTNATTPKINGVPINYAPTAAFNSPYMQSVWGSGRITITFGSQSASYDFSNSANPVKVVR